MQLAVSAPKGTAACRPCGMGVNHGGTGEHVPPEFVLRGTAMMFVPPEFSTYNVLNNAVCHLFILICTRYNVLHCI